MSKLAALAAKRRQKENEKQMSLAADTANSPQDSVSGLSKLSIATQHTSELPSERPLQSRLNLESKPPPKQTEESFPLKTNSLPSRQIGKVNIAEDTHQPHDVTSVANVADLRAKPSLFACTLMRFCDIATPVPPESSNFSPKPVISSFDFSKPSPDDIVLKAQNFKGPR